MYIVLVYLRAKHLLKTAFCLCCLRMPLISCIIGFYKPESLGIPLWYTGSASLLSLGPYIVALGYEIITKNPVSNLYTQSNLYTEMVFLTDLQGYNLVKTYIVLGCNKAAFCVTCCYKINILIRNSCIGSTHTYYPQIIIFSINSSDT